VYSLEFVVLLLGTTKKAKHIDEKYNKQTISIYNSAD